FTIRAIRYIFSGVRIESSARRSSDARLSARWLKVVGTLDEFQARLFVADKAIEPSGFRPNQTHLARLENLGNRKKTPGSQCVRPLAGQSDGPSHTDRILIPTTSSCSSHSFLLPAV